MAGAPKKSKRPRTRADNAIIQRERAAQAELADLEMRADMDAYLKNDALARLGYSVAPLRYTPYVEGRKTFGAATFPSGGMAREMMSPSVAARYDQYHPEDEGKIPPNAIVYDDMHAALPVLAHEARHAGMNELRRRGMLPPIQTFNRYYERYPEEALVETQDVPTDKFNYPSRAGGGVMTMADTLDAHGIQNYRRPGQELMHEIYRELSEIAQKELTGRGEPPKTQPKKKGFLSWIFGE